MKIAIEGCCHGELDAIYAHVAQLEQRNGYTVELLLLCGDFQAIRNLRDLQCMAVPDKYRELGGFCKYYTGEKTAPMLTILIGGNHEASNYLWELYHGGWVAPNIYFLGHAGCVQVNGIRIAGASGIFKPQDFRQGHWERLPYTPGAMRSIYHIREFNVRRLSLLSAPAIVLSHDWPQAVEQHGDVAGLLRRKPHFRADVRRGALGSPPLMGLLRTLRPAWWFAAHLHCRFEARVAHEARRGEDAGLDEGAPAAARNADEIVLDEEEDAVEAAPAAPAETRFLALDKCVPGRQFVEVIDVAVRRGFSAGATPVLAYDAEWLAITRAFHAYMPLSRTQPAYPDEADARSAVRTELGWVRANVLAGEETLRVDAHQQFAMTAGGPGAEGTAAHEQPPYYANPQTAAFCAMLGIENKIDASSSPGAPSQP